MAARKRFHVPSLEEMDETDDNQHRELRSRQVKLSFTDVEDRQKEEEAVASGSGVTTTTKTTATTSKPSALVQCLSKIRETARHAEILEELKTLKPIEPSKVTTGSCSAITTSSNSLLINKDQKGNPLIKFFRNVRFEYREMIPDYIMGKTTCAIFLSLRYHNLYPDYIHKRLKSLGRQYELRVLLIQVDVKDSHHSLKELTKIAILSDCTLLLAWSPEEAAKHIETYKIFENKPADILMKKQESDSYSKVTDALSSVRSINKSDAANLLSTFGTLENIIKASKEDFEVCPGMGPKKVNSLYSTLHEPFLKTKR